jgi:hypothetical protein
VHISERIIKSHTVTNIMTRIFVIPIQYIVNITFNKCINEFAGSEIA